MLDFLSWAWAHRPLELIGIVLNLVAAAALAALFVNLRRAEAVRHAAFVRLAEVLRAANHL